jgi:hypothetical protein
VTFFVARGLLDFPGGDWFTSKLAARRELDAAIERSEVAAESHPARETLEGLTDITLRNIDGTTVKEVLFTFAHYDDSARLLILAVRINDSHSGTLIDHITADFDRLFVDQYDPKTQRLFEDDTAYVVVTLDEHFQPTGEAVVVQTQMENDAYGIQSFERIPLSFVKRLREATP